MATYKIVDASLVPSNPQQPGGAQVTLITYQQSGQPLRTVILPIATPSLTQVQSAVQADVAFRAQFVGQTVTA